MQRDLTQQQLGELVEELGVTRRTIKRDLAALGEAGFPIGVIHQEGTIKNWGVIGPAHWIFGNDRSSAGPINAAALQSAGKMLL